MTDLRKLARHALDAVDLVKTTDATEEARKARKTRDDYLDRLLEVAFPARPTPNPDDALVEALPRIAEADDDVAALDILRSVLTPLQPVQTWAAAPVPETILAGAGGPGRTVLRRGEVGMLAGPGTMGKSTFTLALAETAARTRPGDRGNACGFEVAGGPAVLIGYEDAPAEVARRVKAIREANGRDPDSIPAALHLVEDAPPLFEADRNRPGHAKECREWPAIFGAAKAIQPSLVVVDPATAALADVSASETGPVRAFLLALRREAEEGNFAALVVAHDTKSARDEAARGGDPGAGVVSGSAAWWDAARAVLYLRRALTGGDPDDRLIQSVKANYGRTGWGVRLREVHLDGDRFGGFEAVEHLDRGAVKAALTRPKTKPTKTEKAEDADGEEEAQGADW